MPPRLRHAKGPLDQTMRRVDDVSGRRPEGGQRDDLSVIAAGVVRIRGERAS